VDARRWDVSELKVTVAPVGRMDAAEVEEAALRVSKALAKPVEIREPLAHPKGAEDVSRGQYRAPSILAEARAALPLLRVKKLAGGAAGVPAVPIARPDAVVLVTDLDIFAPGAVWVMLDVDAPRRMALLSVRRMREAFYRRKPDPLKQRARLVKEILRAIGRIHSLPDCGDPGCALAPTQTVADIDRKGEHYCPACWKRLSTGAMRI
jgi:predicted Zn-dependent protease